MTFADQVKAIQELDRLYVLAQRTRRIADVKRYERQRRIVELQSGAVALPVGGEIVQLPRRGVA